MTPEEKSAAAATWQYMIQDWVLGKGIRLMHMLVLDLLLSCGFGIFAAVLKHASVW
eukprot:CAMPEP_0202922008 /NCGR_PEP_ID=MMETSP1392-20130828/77695_1 /ASSEMBLY_ACC=CAM_ASM_000868 /TAXON_ID=225041 /ORGANISM="Chlamydomonas chlamydogama, Strain SAG 11-48b" /LENGTH=55 /DNA_ID=CAMNT_0049615611 /DNA_START=2292 /DNA_END=2456 /DNA_ORIENTATION=+